ncbi:hypothetical protein Acsp03_69260 [Actinomadura sp. NBRC 104412]|nr:hypothetical protein Acsp03_69260 [Actinomadura sp. NBRC 104412]
MTVTACVLVIVASAVLLKGVYDWAGQPTQVAARPLQHDRLVVYIAAIVVIAGAGLFAITGARPAAFAIVVTAVIPVLVILILPKSAANWVALVPSLVTVTLAGVLAVRAVVVPHAQVAPLAVVAFAVVMVAGGIMFVGLLDFAFSFGSTEESLRTKSAGRRVALLSGVVLVWAPVLLMLDGRRWAAAATAPMALVALSMAVRQLAEWAAVVSLLAGPSAVAATIQAMFTSRR